MYHLDIKPQNLALNTENNSNSNEFHVIDLGWVMRGQQPCYLRRATRTYEYSAPEVQRWHEWEDTHEEDPESPPPKRFNPLKADAWAVGNVLLIILSNVLEDEELDVEFADQLWEFGMWLTKKRPRMEEAIGCLNEIVAHPEARRTPSPTDSAIHISSP
ncbi:hypothetical protein AAF712_003878 [Marasmius tenuissimus]|uniref:Protein kinase domain-containing protein n=1 Tax=Marasmius tenuissimus TaxID=585030 RepID=A0ABR3A6P6_9AGAR